jgi:hypothetical protein
MTSPLNRRLGGLRTRKTGLFAGSVIPLSHPRRPFAETAGGNVRRAAPHGPAQRTIPRAIAIGSANRQPSSKAG